MLANVGGKKSLKSTANTPPHLDFSRPEQGVELDLEDQAKAWSHEIKVCI